ncbi:hypothetical protein HY970_03725 [Candidatus Kaiserbacteria bacterium]|nr:hypothetical protein [Candidatus Kaiserbacteria bacterium]
MEAQLALLRAATPIFLEMSGHALQTLVIGNPNLQDNLLAGLALMPKVPAPPIVKKPMLVFIKETALGSSSVTVYGLGKRLAIAEMLRLIVRAPEASVAEIERLVKERKHALPSVDLDIMLDKQAKFFLQQEGGEDFGLRGDGWANLILVENPDGTLSVVYALWRDGRWGRYGCSLGRGGVWGREFRLVVSNSDALNL